MTEPLEPAKPPADRIYGTPLTLQRIEAIREQIAALSKGVPVILIGRDDILSKREIENIDDKNSSPRSDVAWRMTGQRLKDIFERHVDPAVGKKFLAGAVLDATTEQGKYEEIAQEVSFKGPTAWSVRDSSNGKAKVSMIFLPDRAKTLNEEVSRFTGIPAQEFVSLPGTVGDMFAATTFHEARHVGQIVTSFSEPLLSEIDADCGMRGGHGAIAASRRDMHTAFPDFYNEIREVTGMGGLGTEAHREMGSMKGDAYPGLAEIRDILRGRLPSHATHFATDVTSCAEGVDDKGISKLAALQRVGSLVNTLVGIDEHRKNLEAIKSRQVVGDTSQADEDFKYFADLESPAGVFKLHDLGAKAVLEDTGKKYNAFRVLAEAKLFPEGSEEQAHIGRVAGFLRRYAPNYLEDADSAVYRDKLRGIAETMKSGPLLPLSSVDDPTPENEKAKQGIKNLLAPIMKQ